MNCVSNVTYEIFYDFFSTKLLQILLRMFPHYPIFNLLVMWKGKALMDLDVYSVSDVTNEVFYDFFSQSCLYNKNKIKLIKVCLAMKINKAH